MVRCIDNFSVLHDEIEKWIEISGYESLYKVSNLGRVISLRGQYQKRNYPAVFTN